MVIKLRPIHIFTLLTFLSFYLSKDCGNKTSTIKTLPLYDIEKLPCMYSGLVDLDKGTDTQIFYWLIHSETQTDSTPLIVWLNGGPGSSSLFGLFTEMGPLRIKLNGDNLITEVDMKYTWNKVANVLYVDQPIGTGFSFSQRVEDIPKNMTEVANHFYIFLQKFFAEHKELLGRNFYISGESYAGKYIPFIARHILDMNQKIKDGTDKTNLAINLKKILIGNGLFDPAIQREARRDLVMGVNMLSQADDELHLKYLTTKCEAEIANKEKTAADTCNNIVNFIENMSGDVFQYDIRKNRNHDDNFKAAMTKYLNNPNVTHSLNIKEGLVRTWTDNNKTVSEVLKNDTVFSESRSTLEALLSNYNLPIILVGGEFDIMDGPQGIERMIYSMNFTGAEEWRNTPRTLWKVNRDSGGVSVGGYVKQKGKLIFITVRNSGHFFPRDQLGLSMRVLNSMFNDTHELPCVDNNCDLIKYKCDLLGGCNGGLCDASTNGLCKCKENHFGPDCRMNVSKLEDNLKGELTPRETKLFENTLKKNYILMVTFDDYKPHNNSLLVTMIPKSDHSNMFNFDKHPVQFHMTKKENYFFVSEDHLDLFFVFHNSNTMHRTKFTVTFKDFDFSKSNFWGPGGVGFFFSLLMLISGIVLLIVGYLFYKKYKQNKSYQLLSDNIAGNNKELKVSNV